MSDSTEKNRTDQSVEENDARLKFEIGGRLRRLRMALRLRVVDVQKLTGIDYRTLSHYESGRVDIPVTRLIRLVEAYQSDLLWVLTGEATPRRIDLTEAREYARALFDLLATATYEDNPVVTARIRLSNQEAEARGTNVVEEAVEEILNPDWDLIENYPSARSTHIKKASNPTQK